jgi:hypothetical protein
MYSGYVSLNQAISYSDNQNIFDGDMSKVYIWKQYEFDTEKRLKNKDAICWHTTRLVETLERIKDSFLPCEASAHFQASSVEPQPEEK